MRRLPGLLIAAAVLTANPAAAQEQKQAHKLTLRAVMQELQVEFLNMTNALFIDDFRGLEQSAKAIQGHPMPDDIVTAVKNKLGRNFRGFETFDVQSHTAAGDLAKRAAARDIFGSAKAYGRIAEACVGCHKQYRATLKPLSD
jgi:cytochrome c556